MLFVSVPDPDPPDPHVFGPPGSTSHRCGSGSGSFYDQAKIVRKTLIRTVLWLLLDFLSLKNDVYVPSKSNKQKSFFLSCQWRKNSRIWIRIRIRIHYSEAWIRGSRSTPKFHGSGTLLFVVPVRMYSFEHGQKTSSDRPSNLHFFSASFCLVWLCYTYSWLYLLTKNYGTASTILNWKKIKLTMINLWGCRCEFHHCSWTNQGPASWTRQFGGHQNHQVTF